MKEYIIRCENNKFTLEGEVVHCKDCESCEASENTGVSRCFKFDFFNEPDDYCSYGEKQVTSKLNNPDDSLLKADTEECKEQKSKLESDLISRKAAIEEIKNATTITGWNKYASQEEIVDYVERQLRRLFVGAIESLPPVTPTASEDCISRDGLMFALEPMMEDWEGMKTVKLIIETIPPVTPTERTGEWRENELGVFCSACGNGFVCSETDVDEMKREFHFCSNCGAKMKGGTENDR